MGNLGKLGLVERLKNSNFILESKMTKSKSKKKKKIQNNQIYQMLNENFILPYNEIK